MRHYELLLDGSPAKVLAVGSTRAALLEAAVQGLFAAAAPRPAEGETTSERPFDVSAADFESLIVGLLGEALRQSKEHGETYEAVRFTLITDRQAKGAMVGRPAEAFETTFASASREGLEVGRNEEGNWTATIPLKA